MQSMRTIIVLAAAMLTTPVLLLSQSAPQGHVYVTSSTLKWGPAPNSLPPGAQAAVIDGDPTKPGMFVMRLKAPDGFTVPPHWHPTDENIVVLQGMMRIGMGEKIDQKSALELPVGAFMKLPREMRHYAIAKGETVIQLHGMGPFEITYVDKAADPRSRATTR